jgi:hypothetical protein
MAMNYFYDNDFYSLTKNDSTTTTSEIVNETVKNLTIISNSFLSNNINCSTYTTGNF